MFSLSKGQVFIIAGFIVLLLSIPLTFTLVKQTQFFRSSASEIKTTKTPSVKPAITPGKAAEDTSRSELQKLLQEASSSATPTPTQDPTPDNSSGSISFGPHLNMTINIEGRPSANQAAKVFLGIANGAPRVKPTYLLSFTVDFPASGIWSNLSLAGLDAGTAYTAYFKGPGQIDKAVSFTMSSGANNLNLGQPVALLSGDLNEDNTINAADYTIAKNLYGKTPSSPGWNEQADFNRDGIINNLDIGLITKNFGKTGDSGIWYSPPPQTTSSLPLEPGIGGVSTDSGGFWMWFPALP